MNSTLANDKKEYGRLDNSNVAGNVADHEQTMLNNGEAAGKRMLISSIYSHLSLILAC